MNTLKSNYTIFCNGSNTKKEFNFNLFGKKLPQIANPKFLGIIFDERLCFNSSSKYQE